MSEAVALGRGWRTGDSNTISYFRTVATANISRGERFDVVTVGITPSFLSPQRWSSDCGGGGVILSSPRLCYCYLPPLVHLSDLKIAILAQLLKVSTCPQAPLEALGSEENIPDQFKLHKAQLSILLPMSHISPHCSGLTLQTGSS